MRTCWSDVALLIFGTQDGVEYVRRLYKRRLRFEKSQTAHFLNDFLLAEELHSDGGFLLELNDCLKIKIIVKPVSL